MKKNNLKRKITAALLGTAIIATLLTGCGNKKNDKNVIKVGASPTPHAEILNVVKDKLKDKGYKLEIVEYNDYVQPNTALEDGELDANLRADSEKQVQTLTQGISNFLYTPNEARALLLLESEGLIKLKEGAGISATVVDIEENPLELEIKEVEAAQIARTLQDVDIAAINGNYALDAGYKVSDALAVEKSDSLAAKTYANIIAVKEGNEDSAKTKALVEAVLSDEVKEYINKNYDGAVVPVY